MTSICFGISSRSHVALEIYDAGGRLIKVLVNEERAPARYEVAWDGKGESGQAVASGIYFCRLRAGAYSETSRIVLVR
jgi:flagellar hook assembly protein FlgD